MICVYAFAFGILTAVLFKFLPLLCKACEWNGSFCMEQPVAEWLYQVYCS